MDAHDHPLGRPSMPEPIEGFPQFGHIELSGLDNVRDLGGLRGFDGHPIKAARLIRSSSLDKASEEDLRILLEGHDLARIVDLRTDFERDREPDPLDKLPEVRYCHLPVFEGEVVGITHKPGLTADLEAFRHYAHDPFAAMAAIYPTSLLESAGMKAFARFFKILLEAEHGATLWHCTQGKDRTGMAAALIEHALGVDETSIRRDYLATNLYARTPTDRIADLLGRHGMAQGLDRLVDGLLYANEAYLDAAFAAVIKEYGSINAYLARALGVDDEAKRELRHLYLEDREGR